MKLHVIYATYLQSNCYKIMSLFFFVSNNLLKYSLFRSFAEQKFKNFIRSLLIKLTNILVLYLDYARSLTQRYIIDITNNVYL